MSNPNRLGKRLTRLRLCWAIPLISLIWISVAAAADKFNGPWEPVKPAAQVREDSGSVSGLLLDGSLRFFQRYISPADGARCQMYPTCSQYMRLAVRKHGAFLGFVMGCDRLLRDNAGAPDYHRKIIKYRHLYLSDPVEDNDFWL